VQMITVAAIDHLSNWSEKWVDLGSDYIE